MTISTQRRTSHRRATTLNIIFIVLGAFAALLAANSPAAAEPHHTKGHTYKQQVEALEEQWRTAQLSSDVVAMDKLLSDDYIGISLNGQVNTKAQQLDRLRNRRLVLTRIDLSDMKVKLIGSIAIVTSRARVEGTSDGVSVMGIYRYTRIYKRLLSGAWEITSFEATRTPQPRTPNNQSSGVLSNPIPSPAH